MILWINLVIRHKLCQQVKKMVLLQATVTGFKIKIISQR